MYIIESNVPPTINAPIMKDSMPFDVIISNPTSSKSIVTTKVIKYIINFSCIIEFKFKSVLPGFQ